MAGDRSSCGTQAAGARLALPHVPRRIDCAAAADARRIQPGRWCTLADGRERIARARPPGHMRECGATLPVDTQRNSCDKREHGRRPGWPEPWRTALRAWAAAPTPERDSTLPGWAVSSHAGGSATC